MMAVPLHISLTAEEIRWEKEWGWTLQHETERGTGLIMDSTGRAVLALSPSGAVNYSRYWELQYDCGCQDHIHHS